MERQTRSTFNLSLLAVISGITLASALPELPGTVVLLSSLAFSALFLLLYRLYRRHPLFLWLACLGIGFAWSVQHGHSLYQQRLPDVLASRDFLVEGFVINLPEHTERGERFDFEVTQVLRVPAGAGRDYALKKLRLNFYQNDSPQAGNWPFQPGQHWRLQLRLKPPRGFVNPSGFDYEGWLLQQGYSASGYVRNASENQLLTDNGELSVSQWLKRQFDRWAFQSLQWIDAEVSASQRALFAATALGYKEEFTRHEWDLLRDTGTIHLVVVSGLHIVLMASVGYVLVAWLVRLCFFPLQLMPAPVWGALGAMVTAGFYAGMTGFSLPTQRSLVMVLCALMTLLLRQHIPVFTGFLIALLVVLLLDPLAGFSASLWLSFGAVAILLYCFSARVGLHEHWFKTAVYTQCTVSFGLAPLLAWWMGSVPLIMPFANLLAVPWITFVVTPLVIVSGLLFQVWPDFGKILLLLCDSSMELFWWFLQIMQQWNHSIYLTESDLPALWVMSLALVSILVLLAPRAAFGSRAIQFIFGTLLLLPLAFPLQQRLSANEFRMTVIDVGQGLSVMIETAHQVSVYDVGDKFSDQFDIGRDLVAQQVRRRGYTAVDTLIISHADSDHAGGLSGLLAALPVRRLLSGNAEVLRERTGYPVRDCVAGQHWQFDGISFRVLSPPAATYISKRNNRSCVIEVSNGDFSVLLTGDIEALQEQRLVDNGLLQSVDVLLVPHHGSKTSSSPAFLQAVNPSMAIASVGYKSQYGHPHPLVQARYREHGIPLARSDLDGALVLDSVNGVAGLERVREGGGKYWHRW